MPNEPIEFILVRPRGGDASATKYIPRAKYEAQRDLWAQVAGGKTVTADQAPVYTEPTPEASATTSGTKSGQKAASEKEIS
jgi:hypothetical protein